MPTAADAGGAAPAPTVATAPGVPQPSPADLAQWARNRADSAAAVLEREQAGLKFARNQAAALIANAEQAVTDAQADHDRAQAEAEQAERAAGGGS